MSLLTSADQRCLFCAGRLRRYPLADSPGEPGEARDLEILWSDCLECGFTVPTSARAADRVLGDVDRVAGLVDEGPAALVLPGEAAVRFHPASPDQLLAACREVGFDEVHLELLGDELVAAAYREHWRGAGEEETWIRSTSEVVIDFLRVRHPDLLERLVPVATPAEAAARHLRATRGEGTAIVHAGLEPPAPDGTRTYVPFSLAGLARLMEQRGVDPTGMPDEPAGEGPLRRRHLSVPGGLPRAMLEEETESSPRFHKVRDLAGLDAIARALAEGAGGFGFVDALPFDGPLAHPGLGEPTDLARRRRIVGRMEAGRADEPVVEPAGELELAADHASAPAPDVLAVEDAAPVLARTGADLDQVAGPADRALVTCPFRMQEHYRRALEDTRHDPEGGGLSREAFRERFEQEVARANRYGSRFALLLVDVDQLEVLVEEGGRRAAAAVMRELGRVADDSVRDSDVVGRVGTDRLGVMLINPEPAGVRKVAEKIRERAAADLATGGPRGDNTTVSVGIAYQSGETRGSLTVDDLLAEADAALYIARAKGGDQVHPSTDEELEKHES